MYFFANIPRWIRQIFDHFQPQGKCIEAVDVEPKSLGHVSDQYKTQEMCDKAVKDDPETQQYFLLFLTVLKQKKCVSRPLG